MEKQVSVPLVRCGLSAVTAIVSLTLLLSHPDIDLLMGIFAFVGFFGVLALTLPERARKVNHGAQSGVSPVRDGGSGLSLSATCQRGTGAPLRSGDGGSFPVSMSKLLNKR